MSQPAFIAFEGVEGCGKSTQVALLAEALRRRGHSVTTLREPGGTALGERVREILLHGTDLELTAAAEMHLFAAARAQLVRQAVRPALARGDWVLCDRFVHSSIAYQGYARGLGRDLVASVNASALAGCWPDLVLLVDLPLDVALTRAAARGSADRFEGEGRAFHEAVQRGFRAEAQLDPERFAIVDGRAPAARVAEAVGAVLQERGW